MVKKIKSWTLALALIAIHATSTTSPSQAQDAESSKTITEKLHGHWLIKGRAGSLISDEPTNFWNFGRDGKLYFATTEGNNFSARCIGVYSVDSSKKPHHLTISGKRGTTEGIIEFIEDGKLWVDFKTMPDENWPIAFSDNSYELLRVETLPQDAREAEKEAGKLFDQAELNRRKGKFDISEGRYEFIRIRFPTTEFAKKAELGVEHLKQFRFKRPDGSDAYLTIDQPDESSPQPKPQVSPSPPESNQSVHEFQQEIKLLESRLAALEAAITKVGRTEAVARVGRIIVVGNTKTPTPVFLKEIALVPGQVLDSNSLKNAERKMAALDATVEAIDANEPGCKDILVRVHKK